MIQRPSGSAVMVDILADREVQTGIKSQLAAIKVAGGVK